MTAGFLAAALTAFAEPTWAALPGVNGRVFIGGALGSGVLSVEFDGSDLREEQPAFSGASGVVLAPDGLRKYTLTSGAGSGTLDWTFEQLDGSDPLVVEGVPSEVDRAAISPDGQRVAFSSSTPQGAGPLFVANIAGEAAPTQISVSGAATIPGLFKAVWTPNGTELVGFTLDGTAGNPRRYHVGVVTVATGEARDAFTFANPNWHFSLGGGRAETIDVLVDGLDVSPDGTSVAFVRNRQRVNGCPVVAPSDICETLPNYQLVSVPLSGGAETVVTQSGEYQHRVNPPTCTVAPAGGRPDNTPSWSPDGTEIAVAWSVETYAPGTCSYSRISSLRAVPAAGGAPRVLASGENIPGPQYGQPAWTRRPAPVIFIPGFLASKLRCGAEELWPHLGLIDRPRLSDMGLADDGITDLPGPLGCGPVQTDGVVENAGGDIHASTLAFLRRIAPGANHVYPWDWRKSPQRALAGLEDLIDQVRLENGDQKVMILAHSFGGLLTRWYLDDPTRADKVERALIVGTPSWGSPKAIFPLATGQETPLGAVGLDLFLDNDEMKTFARNLVGAYFLYPSGPFGRWLSVRGRVPDDLDDLAKVADYVADDLGGNRALLELAQDAHADVLDGWKTNGVDVRALVGTGMNTVVKVDLQPEQGITAPDRAVLTLGNGDETVPARSAVQGDPGTTNPFGEDIPIHYTCRVSHVPLASDANLTASGAEAFLARGGELSASTSPCSNGGFVVEMAAVELGPRARFRAAAGPDSPSLQAAEAAGKVDVIRFPAQTIAVTNDAAPVSITLPANTQITVRRIDGEANGEPQTIGPLPGGLTLTTAAAGTVQVDPVTPAAPPATSLPGAPAPASGGGPAATAKPRDTTRPKVSVKVRKKGRRYVVTIRAADASGIRRIDYRLTPRGTWKRYRKPLTLRPSEVRALRARATDRAGNTSRPATARLPR